MPMMKPMPMLKSSAPSKVLLETKATHNLGSINAAITTGTKTSQFRKMFRRMVATSVQVSALKSPSLGLRKLL